MDRGGKAERQTKGERQDRKDTDLASTNFASPCYKQKIKNKKK